MATVLTPPAAVPIESGTSARRERGRTSTPWLPRALVALSGLVVATAGVLAVLGAIRTGISWDEPYHVMRLDNFLHHGWFSLDWSVGDDEAASGGTNTLVYGPVTMLLLHVLGCLVGVETWGHLGTTPAAYDVRHLGIVLIGLVGTGAAAATTRILLRSWRWALVTAAVLLALPMWTGHLMFNLKDVPVATGYSLMTLALVAMVRSERRGRVCRVLCLVAGVVLMVGTRPGMAAAVAISVGALGVALEVGRREDSGGSLRVARPMITEVATGLAVSAALLVLIYPNVFAHPFSLLTSAEQSSSFRGGEQASYGYVPFYVLAQVPLLLLGFLGIGLLAATRFVRRRWRTETAAVLRVSLVAVQLLALPLAAVVKHSDLYNGLRQLLFAAPAWAVVVTLGLARALVWARVHRRTRLVGGLALVALAAPMVDQATLFPYQYTYNNAAVDAVGLRLPSDYWRVSIPELIAQIPQDAQVVCGPTRANPRGVLAGKTAETSGLEAEARLVAGRYSSDSSVDCRTDPLGPLAPYWAAEGRSLAQTLPHDTFYVIVDRGHPVPRNCTQGASVDRDQHGRTVPMTYVAWCTAIPPQLGATAVRFDRPSPAEAMDPAQWAYAAEGWVARRSTDAIDAAADEASLSFSPTGPCATGTRGCVLVLDADAPADLTASVEDAPVDVEVTRGAVSLHLPPGASSAWVAFRRTSGSPLDLRVRSLRLVGPSEDKASAAEPPTRQEAIR